MFNLEHLSLNNQFITLPTAATLIDLSTYLQNDTAVLVLDGSDFHLFTPEDVELMNSFSSLNIHALIEHNRHFVSQVFTEQSKDLLLQPLTAKANRPYLWMDKSGTIKGYFTYANLWELAYKEQQKWSAYFEALADTVTDAVTVVDRDGAVICWNSVAEELYKLPKDQIMGKRIGEHFDIDTIMVLKILDEGRMIRNTYHRPRSDTHVLINASPIRNEEGLIIGGIATEQDITNLVRLNEQLTTVDSFGLPTKGHAEDLFALIKGKGPAIGKVVQWAKKIAATETPVLLIGESGVGKEQMAHIIHQSSSRSEQPFLTVHCGLIPSGLLETELFGYQGGAFSGSEGGQPGKLEQAKEGTLFINEVEKLPLELQAKLFLYLTNHTIVRPGGHQQINLRTRIIIATTEDLASHVAKHEFRSDLYYALNVVSIRIPPLRERSEDIPAMVQMYVKQFSLQYQKPAPALSPEVILALTQYAWPGNIQELKNVIERCLILTDEGLITLDHLPLTLQQQQPSLLPFETETSSVLLKEKVTDTDEISLIEDALRKTARNKSAAAKLLGISRGTLYNKMKEFEME